MQCTVLSDDFVHRRFLIECVHAAQTYVVRYTTYVFFIVIIDEIISFISVNFRFIRVLISSKLASNFRSSLNKRRIDNTFFFFFFIVIRFCMRFLIIKCCISVCFFSLLIFIISVFLFLNFLRIFWLLRIRSESSTRVLRFFSSLKTLLFYCDRVCIDVCLCFECVTVDSLQLIVYVHQLLFNVAVFDEQQKKQFVDDFEQA